MMRKVWHNSNEYLRILEILDDYWLSNPDEAEVRVEMYFRHENGETQAKRIIWRNPNLRTAKSNTSSTHIIKLSEVKRPITT